MCTRMDAQGPSYATWVLEDKKGRNQGSNQSELLFVTVLCPFRLQGETHFYLCGGDHALILAELLSTVTAV